MSRLHSTGSHNNCSGEPPTWRSFILRHRRAKGMLSRLLVWFLPRRTCGSVQTLPLAPGVSPVTTGWRKRIADCIGQGESPGSTLQCLVRQVPGQSSASQEFQSRGITRTDSALTCHFPVAAFNAKFKMLVLSLIARQGGEGGHTCIHPALIQGGLKETERGTETEKKYAQTSFFHSMQCGWPRVRARHPFEGLQGSQAPVVYGKGDTGLEFLSRVRMKLLIETGRKNNETTGSQKCLYFPVERECRDQLTSSSSIEMGKGVNWIPMRSNDFGMGSFSVSLLSSSKTFQLKCLFLYGWCLWELTRSYSWFVDGKSRSRGIINILVDFVC